MRRHVLALSLLCALPLQAAIAADTLRWPNPWKVGQVLVYETEGLETEVDGDKREKTRDADRTTIRIAQATQEGYLQEWRSRDATFEVIEGDQAMAGLMSAAMKGMGDLAVEATLDKDGNYTGIRNIDAVATRMRTAMRPVMAAAIDARLAKQPEAQRAALQAKAHEQVEKVLDGITSPAVVATMLGRVIETYNAFVGVELEAGQWYELDTELDTPVGR
jgi:hypothetical protein